MKKPSKKWAFNMPNTVQLSHGVELSSLVCRLRACSGDVEGEGQREKCEGFMTALKRQPISRQAWPWWFPLARTLLAAETRPLV